MNRKLLKALDDNGFVTIDFPEGSVKVNPDTLQVYTPKGYPAKQRILFGYKASIITFCLGKSCSNSNNQWITTDIVIFVEYL